MWCFFAEVIDLFTSKILYFAEILPVVMNSVKVCHQSYRCFQGVLVVNIALESVLGEEFLAVKLVVAFLL